MWWNWARTHAPNIAANSTAQLYIASKQNSNGSNSNSSVPPIRLAFVWTRDEYARVFVIVRVLVGFVSVYNSQNGHTVTYSRCDSNIPNRLRAFRTEISLDIRIQRTFSHFVCALDVCMVFFPIVFFSSLQCVAFISLVIFDDYAQSNPILNAIR